LLGDDLLVTNEDRLDRAIEHNAANAVLVKPNQAGTITRAIDVVHHAKNAGCNPVVSARSGETCDSTIADLAIGLDAGQIKIGSLARSERLAKYNRLLEIESETTRNFASFALPSV
jgi:enolase